MSTTWDMLREGLREQSLEGVRGRSPADPWRKSLTGRGNKSARLLSVVASESLRSSREAGGPGAREQRARSPEQERASPGRPGEDSGL